MRKWLVEYFEMIKELEVHPEIIILTNVVFPGAKKHEIDEVHQYLGYELAPNLTSFFQEANGIQLRWIHKKSKYFNPDKHTPQKGKPVSIHDIIKDDGKITGCINLLPIKDVFINDLWYNMIYFDDDSNDESIEFGGKSFPKYDFMTSIRPFDYFHFSNDMAFILVEKSPYPYLVKGEDHQANYFYSLRVSFQAYLQFLIKSFGLVNLRGKAFFSHEGHQNPPLNSFEEIPIKKEQYNLNSF